MYCSPDAARLLVERLPEPKQGVWLPTTNHIDLYDNPTFVEPAVDAAAEWFDRHLAPPAT